MEMKSEAKCVICKNALPGVETWNGRFHVCEKQSCKDELVRRKRGVCVAPGELQCGANDCKNSVASGYYHRATKRFACSKACYLNIQRHYVEKVCAHCGRVFKGRQRSKNCSTNCRDAAERVASEACIGELLSEFQEYEKAIKEHYSRQGKKMARTATLNFMRFLHEAQITDPCKVDAKVITDYVNWARVNGMKASICYLSFISVYMDWLIFQGRRTDNPVTRFHRRKTPKRLPRPYSEEEMKQIWSWLERRGSTQAKLACAIAEEGGCRISEICNLRLEDVDPKGTRLFIRLPNKTMTERWVPVYDKTRSYLAIWLCERDDAVGHDHLLHSHRGLPYNSTSLHSEIVTAVCKTKQGRMINEDGLDKWSTHRLRHTMATRLVRGGADYAALMSIGGWVTNTSAAGYAKVEDEVAERSYRETMARLAVRKSEPSTIKSSFTKYVKAPDDKAA
jgi:integrase